MNQQISLVSYLVRDYDEAIHFFCEQLNFRLIEDSPLDEGKRWVRVAPPGNDLFCLLLAKAIGKTQVSRVGDQTGGRVFLFLYTDNFERDYQQMKRSGIQFLEVPRKEPYGQVVVFQDLYGNKWDLIEPF